MADQAWVAVAQHLMPNAWVPVDPGSAELLFFEAVLRDSGIEVAFDPFRPGEGGGFTRDCAQPVRLLVMRSDLQRARALIAEASRSELLPPE